MLQATLQFLITMIACAINERGCSASWTIRRRKSGFSRRASPRPLATIGSRSPLISDVDWPCGEALSRAGLGGRLIRKEIVSANDAGAAGRVACRSRIGGLLKFYCREAA
jgi:hypothetical protein